MEDKFCLYLHKKPDGEVFYVGIGLPSRPFKFVDRSKWWNAIVKKYGTPTVEIICENLSWIDAQEWEILYIKYYGRKDLGLGTLVNMTDGGEGYAGPKSKTHRQKISTALKGNTNASGYKHSTEARAKISESKKGKIGCPPWNKGKTLSLKTKKRMSISQLRRRKKK